MRLSTRAAFAPAAPRDATSATSIDASAGWLATRRTSHSGSWSSRLIVGGMAPSLHREQSERRVDRAGAGEGVARHRLRRAHGHAPGTIAQQPTQRPRFGPVAERRSVAVGVHVVDVVRTEAADLEREPHRPRVLHPVLGEVLEVTASVVCAKPATSA